MIPLLFILLFISLYGLSLTGGRVGRNLFISALLLHGAYLIFRGLFLDRLPVTERQDILLVAAFGASLGFFYFRKSVALDLLLNVLIGFVLVLCLFAVFQERMDTIEPIMNSSWFYIYMTLFIAGLVLLTLSSVAGVFYLLNAGPYETLQYRLALFGWLFFSFSLIAGSVWFFRVYGVYWLWTAKELWTTIVWFYYGFYLHSRMVARFRGRPASVIGVLGFGVMLFSYIGVAPILGSPWTQF